MDKTFIIQLILSFLVGGSFIALLSILAEKSSEKTAGLIISLPSTMALGLFFIGWTISPKEVANIAPIALLTLGGTGLSTITYLYLSKIKLKKIHSIILCTLASLLVWTIFAIPLALFKFSNLLISIVGLLLILTIPYYFVTIRPRSTAHTSHQKYSASQKIARAIFAGFIITLAVFLANTLNPFWGGIFSSFPATFTSSLIIIHWHNNSDFLFRVWKTFPLGFVISAIYPIVAIYTFPAWGIWGGTLTAYAATMIVFFITRQLTQKRNA